MVRRYNMKDELDLSALGRPGLIPFVEDSMDIIGDWMKDWKKYIDDVMHIRVTDIDDLEKTVKEYAEEHPDSDIQVTAFAFSIKDPKHNKKVKFTNRKEGE